MKKRLSQIFLLILIIVIIIFLRKYTKEFYRLLEIPTNSLIIVSILILISIFFNAYKIKVLTDFFSLNLKIKEWFGLLIISKMGNFITPFRGGAGVKAIYLKKKYNLPYSSFMAMLSATLIISFFIYTLLGVIAVLGTLFFDLFNISLFLFFIILLIITTLTILFPPSLSKTKYKFVNHFVKLINEWRIMRRNLKLIFSLIILDIIDCLLIALRLYFLFQALAYNIPFMLCLLIMPFVAISSLITITPAALGIREGAAAFSSKIIGFGVVSGALASTLDRIITMIIVFILCPVFSYILIRKFTFYNKQSLTKQI